MTSTGGCPPCRGRCSHSPAWRWYTARSDQADTQLAERPLRAPINTLGAAALCTLYAREEAVTWRHSIMRHVFWSIAPHGALVMAMDLVPPLRTTVYAMTHTAQYINDTSPFERGLRTPGLTYGLSQTLVLHLVGVPMAPLIAASARGNIMRALIGLASLVIGRGRDHVLNVSHVITGLETGGAETSLVRLIAAMGPSVLHSVVSLTSRGTQASAIESLGASVHALNWPRSVPGPSAMRALLLHTRSIQPDVVHGWMYHGNLAASSAAWACARTPRVIWGVRHALDPWSCESPRLRRTIRLSARSSRSAQHIVYNSARARRQHEALGFRADRSVVIPNGFDLMRFAPDQASRSRIRAELRLPPVTPLVGLVARVDR